jgi:hypothetical protein
MSQKLLSHVRNQWMGALALFLVLTGGTALALTRNTVGSPQIKKNAVGSSEIKPNAVGKSEIKADTVTGSEVNEGTLGEVPSAANATNAANAANATNATNADTVGGNTVREVNYSATPVSGPQTILDLGGLQLSANCAASSNTNLVATTTKDGSSASVSGIYSAGADDTNGARDINSGEFDNGDFDVGTTLDLDSFIGDGFADGEHGSLAYFAPDGSTVTAFFVLDEFGSDSCHVNGFAIGG